MLFAVRCRAIFWKAVVVESKTETNDEKGEGEMKRNTKVREDKGGGGKTITKRTLLLRHLLFFTILGDDRSSSKKGLKANTNRKEEEAKNVKQTSSWFNKQHSVCTHKGGEKM